MTELFQKFIIRNDSRISAFANNISDFKINNVSINYIKARERTINWLKNFDEMEFTDFELPLLLLEKIEIIQSSKITKKLNEKAEFLLNQPNSYIAPLGEQSESSFRITSQNNRSNKFFISIQELLDNIPDSIENKIILFDDFLNSGGQIITIFKRLLGVPFNSNEINDEGDSRPELNENQKRKLLNAQIHLFYYKVFDEGNESLEITNKELNLQIKVHRCTGANDTDGAFGDKEEQAQIEAGVTGVLFTNCSFMGKEYRELQELYNTLRRAGEELLRVNEPNWAEQKLKERCLGYGNSCRVIVTEYNVPTITLTALWLGGEISLLNKKIKWNELLPREKKILSKNQIIKPSPILNDEEKASVTALKNFHDNKNIEQYLADFEEATGFEDYVIELQGSRYHPKNIIPEIKTSFDFLGHGASKWTNEFDLLNRAIERIKRNMGLSRFLIFDPRNAVGLEDHGDISEDIQEQKKILNSLLVLKKLANRHNRKGNEVQIRIYPELPKFRLGFINHQIVLVGHYNGHTRNSNESPIMVFNSDKEWSFYSAFKALFNENWDRGTNLDDSWGDLQELYEARGIKSSLT
jgi:hypothetical protein